MQRAAGKPPLGVVFDAPMGDRIADALALALLYGLARRAEARLVAMATSKPSLGSAAFCDLLVRFYGGDPGPFRIPMPIGMATSGEPAPDPPLLSVPLANPVYSRGIRRLNDTADPVAAIRNALTAQVDGNAVIVLTGPPSNLAGLLALPGARDLIGRKVRILSVAAAPGWGVAGNRVLADWPGAIVLAPQELGDALPFPAASLDREFGWTPAHPIADAWRAAEPSPHDAPSTELAAALYAVRADAGYFRVSEPGTVSVDPGGQPVFTLGASGRHRTLAFDPSQKERLLEAYLGLCAVRPVPGRTHPGK